MANTTLFAPQVRAVQPAFIWWPKKPSWQYYQYIGDPTSGTESLVLLDDPEKISELKNLVDTGDWYLPSVKDSFTLNSQGNGYLWGKDLGNEIAWGGSMSHILLPDTINGLPVVGFSSDCLGGGGPAIAGLANSVRYLQYPDTFKKTGNQKWFFLNSLDASSRQKYFIERPTKQRKARIYFTPSIYSNESEISQVYYSVIDSNKATAWGDNSMIKTAAAADGWLSINYNACETDAETGEKYFEIEFDDSFKDLVPNQYYQLQLRVEDAEGNKSAVSQVSLLRPISTIDLTVSSANNKIAGEISSNSGETLKSVVVISENADLDNETLGVLILKGKARSYQVSGTKFEVDVSWLQIGDQSCTVIVETLHGYKMTTTTTVEVTDISQQMPEEVEEGVFLSDQDAQIAIRYNTAVSGLKYVVQENITNTLGGKYPIIRRNGHTKYRQFSLAGLLYLDPYDHVQSKIVDSRPLEWSIETDPSLWTIESKPKSFSGSHRKVESQMRDFALEWLCDGRVKLFRSAEEGNMIVYLSAISFTPNKQLGGHVYDFTATVTEVCDYNYANLIKFQLIQTYAPVSVTVVEVASTPVTMV